MLSTRYPPVPSVLFSRKYRRDANQMRPFTLWIYLPMVMVSLELIPHFTVYCLLSACRWATFDPTVVNRENTHFTAGHFIPRHTARRGGGNIHPPCRQYPRAGRECPRQRPGISPPPRGCPQERPGIFPPAGNVPEGRGNIPAGREYYRGARR